MVCAAADGIYKSANSLGRCKGIESSAAKRVTADREDIPYLTGKLEV